MTCRIYYMPVHIPQKSPSNKDSDIFPYSTNGMSFWYGASQAIYQGIRIIGLQKGDRVLVPAYCCGNEIDPLIKAGLTLEFYRILPDLTPDFKHLHELRSGFPRALFITHFFGLSQPMDAILKFTHDNDILLIEDNAHGLFSSDSDGRELGCFGDFAAFSFTKSLPLTHGGGLIFNTNSNYRDPKTSRLPSKFSVGIRKAEILKEKIANSLGRNYPFLINTIDNKVLLPIIKQINKPKTFFAMRKSAYKTKKMNSLEFKMETADWSMLDATIAQLQDFDPTAIKRKRRNNFQLLLKSLDKNLYFEPLIKNLDQGCCPLFFPIRTRNPEALIKYLFRKGIITVPFWSYFHEKMPQQLFPFESELKKSVVVLPVHQELGEDDMVYLSEQLNAYKN